MGKTSNSHFLPLQSFTKGLRIPCLIWLCTAVWGGIGAAIFFFSWEKKRLRRFRVKCTRKYIQWGSDIEVKQYTNNYHLLCTCHLPSCSVFTGEVCHPSFTDRDKERCREAKESEKWWKQNWAFHAGQTDLTAQVPPLTIHCLQKPRCYSPAHFPLQPKQSAGAPRAADPPRNPAPGAVAHCSPRNAAATQPTSLGYLWDSPCSQKTSVLRLFIPPLWSKTSTYCPFSAKPRSGFCSQLPPSPPPHRQSGLLTGAEPAPKQRWMFPFVSEALGWLWRLESLNNNDESEYLFLRFSPSCLFISP